jgi:hypothetical protein
MWDAEGGGLQPPPMTLQAWSVFGQNECGTKFISLLEIITRNKHGKDATITTSLLNWFEIDYPENIKAQINLHSNKVLLNPPYCFFHYINKEQHLIGTRSVCPIQFPSGKLLTMTSLLDKHETGWDNVNVHDYFRLSKGCGREDLIMSTSKEYEECCIIFETLKQMKLTQIKNKRDPTKFEWKFE